MTDAKTGESMRNLAEIMARLQDKKLPPALPSIRCRPIQARN